VNSYHGGTVGRTTDRIVESI